MIIDYPALEQVPGLRSLWKEAFGDTDAFLDNFFKTAFDPRRCRCITKNAQIVASLYWFDCACQDRKIAYVYAIATQKASRGQGLCSSLMDDTHHLLTQQGYDGAILVPGSEGLFRFYEKLGYTTCAYRDSLTVNAAEKSATIEQISSDAFAAKRRMLLPAGAVVQEGASLAFLSSYASFYAGENFLLTAYRQEDTLVGVELLGDRNAAAGIVSALGCRSGIFHVPGDALPFAMYYPLRTGQAPQYLGFAFD